MLFSLDKIKLRQSIRGVFSWQYDSFRLVLVNKIMFSEILIKFRGACTSKIIVNNQKLIQQLTLCLGPMVDIMLIIQFISSV